jgi:hypothetical protein
MGDSSPIPSQFQITCFCVFPEHFLVGKQHIVGVTETERQLVLQAVGKPLNSGRAK